MSWQNRNSKENDERVRQIAAYRLAQEESPAAFETIQINQNSWSICLRLFEIARFASFHSRFALPHFDCNLGHVFRKIHRTNRGTKNEAITNLAARSQCPLAPPRTLSAGRREQTFHSAFERIRYKATDMAKTRNPSQNLPLQMLSTMVHNLSQTIKQSWAGQLAYVNCSIASPDCLRLLLVI